MKESGLKYIFWFLSVLFLFTLLLASRNAGITCDEVLHYNHSVDVYNYFASNGADQSALNTPVTHLKYYGQSYDNLATIIIKWFSIDNIYGFRHFMSSIAGWLTILITAIFAVWLSGYRTGIIVLLLFAVSPTFIGHSQNNLKDIPFALAYVSGTFFILKFLVSERKVPLQDIILLTSSIAFSISIRAGGLLVICYLIFFFFLFYLIKYLKKSRIDLIEIRTKLLWVLVIILLSLFLSILLWPFALQSPIRNILESYRAMAHFPDTFRQIFEGKSEWSDFMPWYYIPKSILITIPLIVTTGLILLVVFARKMFRRVNILSYGLIAFTILFPLIFVVYEKSNTYSSWRQFLFIYPAIILLASEGLNCLFENVKSGIVKWGIIVLFAALSIHPLKFMIKNHPYEYLYYNQLVGGVNGAYSNYEMDYYYVSQTEASEWLINYLKEKKTQGKIKVKATYSVAWLFRNHPAIETSYFRYEERSQSDWDYAIVVNRYISPYQLKNNIWPPKNAIHIIYSDQVPLCAVIERRSKDDFNGYCALNEGRSREAVKYFEMALKVDDKDELIFYNFAAALYNDGQYQKADSVLKAGLVINPDFEPILMYLGNIARTQNKNDEAAEYYSILIKANRKYLEAYVGLSEILVKNDIMQARSLLRTCLTIDPDFRPAIVALAGTYRNSNPDIAKKYDEQANRLIIK